MNKISTIPSPVEEDINKRSTTHTSSKRYTTPCKCWMTTDQKVMLDISNTNAKKRGNHFVTIDI